MIEWRYDSLVLVGILWIFYAALYIITRSFTYLHPVSGYLALFGEAGANLVCAFLAFSIALKTEQLEKLLMQLFAASFLFGVIFHGGYNAIVNIIGISNFLVLIETIGSFSFSVFLLLQTSAWFLIARLVYQKNKSYLRDLLSLSFLIFGASILLFFFLIPHWKANFISVNAIYNNLDVLLETFSFALVVICLFFTKDKKVALLASGYLIIITSELVARFLKMEEIIFSSDPIEIIQVLGSLVFAVGLIQLQRSLPINLRQNLGGWNSFKVQMTYWLFTSSLISVFIFLLINRIFLNLDLGNIYEVSVALIVFIVISALVGYIISAYLMRPFKSLDDIVYIYQHRDFASLHKAKSRVQIEEFKELENCLYDNLKAMESNAVAEHNYSECILQYLNKVQNPISAIRMLVEDIDELPEEKKTLLMNAANKISKITDSLSDELRLINKEEIEISTRQGSAYNSGISVIMIDDNKNLAMAWEMEAANAGIDLIAYNTPEAFIKDIALIDKKAIIYIDVNLSSDMTGVDLSKWAYDHNFKNLYLITGGDQSQFQNISWIKGVRGKTPPFITDED